MKPQYERRVGSRNDQFQLLSALLTNRNKRHRLGRFLVHGVRSIELVLEVGWPLEALLVSETASSSWSTDLVAHCEAVGVAVVWMAADLVDELSERADGAEAIAVASTVTRSIEEVEAGGGPLIVLEAVKSPGNLGMIVRSADALGASGFVVTGHAADVYDPQCVRASTGALFTVPFTAARSVPDVRRALSRRLVGLHPDGEIIDHVDLDGRIAFVAGTEATGLSRPAIEHCDSLASIPMTGTTASLNVGTAVAVALAEVARRHRSS